MKLRRRIVALAFVASSGTWMATSMSWMGCSENAKLGTDGTACDVDEQCDPKLGLVCKCVRRRNPDDEGPDEILAHGKCAKPETKCANTDAGPIDAKVDTSDASTDTALPPDTTDDASESADAPTDTSDEAAADGG